jgi:hypothetical protein
LQANVATTLQDTVQSFFASAADARRERAEREAGGTAGAAAGAVATAQLQADVMRDYMPHFARAEMYRLHTERMVAFGQAAAAVAAVAADTGDASASFDVSRALTAVLQMRPMMDDSV